MKKLVLPVIGTLMTLGLLLAMLSPLCAAPKPLQIKGSDTMVNLGQAWAEAFMKKTKIPVTVTGGGSGTGIAALINGKTDVCESSRAMKSEEIQKARENGITPNAIEVAWDGISVVVNPKNPVKQITMQNLAKIYLGELDNWKAFGGPDAKIVVLGRENVSGTFVFFKEHVLQGYKPGSDYVKTMLMLSSNQAIHDEVANNAYAIGYIGLGYVTPKVKDLAVAAADGKPYIPASVKTVKNKTYPVARPLYWYTNGKPAGVVKQIVDFVLGKEGQKIVVDLDFVPMN